MFFRFQTAVSVQFRTAMELSILKLLSFFVLLIPSFNVQSQSLPRAAVPTKSGYLPISSTTTSAMFYTFYEAQKPITSLSETPILIWLQGGPGCSSMLGNFFELGPWRLNPLSKTNNLTLERNSGSWNRLFGLLFIDNPIGVGFSIAATPEDIPTDQDAVAKHLFIAIKKFVALDPSFKTRPIYITGESYAGKYVPSIGYYILNKNPELPLGERINLAGVAIGNGLTDPITQVGTHAVSAYYSGLVNEKQKAELEQAQSEAIKLTKAGLWSNATDARGSVLNTLQNMTGLATLYDFSREVPYQTKIVAEFLASEEVKKALKANISISFTDCNDNVGMALYADVMKSVKYMVEYLVTKTRVLLYQGHLDLRDGVVSVEAWVKTMKWEGINHYLEEERQVWKVNGELAGYVQSSSNLTQVVVLGAGHLVPTDQALHSQAMIEDWVLERGLYARKLKENYSREFRGSL